MGGLEVDGLTVAYGESIVVRGASLEVAAGEVACLMGRNGVGKTTLVKAIAGLQPARTGRVLVEDRDLTREEPHVRARAGVGYVPQGRGIFPYLTVEENLLMGFEAVGRVDHAQVGRIYDRFPVLRQMRRRVAGTLSGGQQQQLAIGRALVGRPRFLLLDEPTEGIQPSIVADIEELVSELRAARETGILLVEQFLDFALAVADRYYVMEHGTIVAQGIGADLASDTVREHLAV